MKNQDIALFIINSTDEYLSEYVSLEKNSRYFITGFSGSTGDVIVTPEKVYLFVDGRYHLQAERETNPEVVIVVKVGLDKSPTKALYEKLEDLSITEEEIKIGIVSTKTSCQNFKILQEKFDNKKHVNIVEYEFDPINPAQQIDKLTKLRHVPQKISIKTAKDKVALVKKYMKKNDIDLLVITSLEEIAYLTNMRGMEIPYSSCFKARAVIFQNKLHVFREESKFNDFLANLLVKNVYYNTGSTTLSVYRKIEKISEKVVEIKDSFISELKSIKNPAELYYMKDCFLKTDIAVSRAICWLNQNIERGMKISEKDFSDKVKKIFLEEGATGLSFEPIAASGDNSAFIHYTNPNPEKLINKGELVLLDCGAYFEYGYATDQTRTFLAGGTRAIADDLQKQAYTAVLKGLLNGLNYEINDTTTGYDIDKLVRDIVDLNKPDGFNFSHATGHGIGIAVHESPPRIGPSEFSKTPLKPGMCFTIEPGLYCDGWGGIRLENTVALIEENEEKKIKTLTRVGFDNNLINYDMLTQKEKNWLNEYKLYLTF